MTHGSPTEQTPRFAVSEGDRPSMRWLFGAVATLVVHAALAGGIFAIKKPKKPSEIVTISVVDSDEQKPKKKPEPPPPAPEPAKALEEIDAAAPPPAPAQEAPPPRANNNNNNVQRGTPLGGDPYGGDSGPTTGGMAIPQFSNDIPPPEASAAPASKPAPTATQTVQKTLAPKPVPSASGCADPATKPKAKSVPQPNYPQAAREAQVQGKVRVEVTVDAAGNVTSARVVAGLGHGLDEAALSAARQAKFEPATQCGKPVSATFVIGMRFSL